MQTAMLRRQDGHQSPLDALCVSDVQVSHSSQPFELELKKTFKYNFWVFVLGQHRNFGTHISKVKSVNLDKWPVNKLAAFQQLSNDLVNSYWEANLPSSFRKPGPNAPSTEVQGFLTDKYVNKKYIDQNMKYDPIDLYENRPERF